MDYPGGVPTSKKDTGEQWDYPNAWPPLQQMLIEALNSSDLEEAKQCAFDLAQKWTLTNFLAYKENKVMYEKVLILTLKVPENTTSVCEADLQNKQTLWLLLEMCTLESQWKS